MPIYRFGMNVLILVSLTIYACGSPDFKYQIDESIKSLTARKTPYPDVRFAVIADPHYHDPSLGTDGYTAKIESRFIRSTPSFPEFDRHAQRFCHEKSVLLVNAKLKKYYVSQADIERINTKAANAVMAHLVGDESAPESPATSEDMGLWGKFVFSRFKGLIDAWHKDLYPADNQVTIDLKTGKTI